MTKARKQLSLEMIEAWLKDSDWRVRQAAMNACQGRDVPLTVIEAGLKDSDWRVRQAAMNACQGRDVPLTVIEAVEGQRLRRAAGRHERLPRPGRTAHRDRGVVEGQRLGACGRPP